MNTKPLPIPDWMIIDAVRYAIGRKSHQVKLTTSWLVENWDDLPHNIKNIVQQDLEEEFSRDDAQREDDEGEIYYALGMDIDRREWEKIRALWKK